jgi:hypothetical protein
MALACAIRNITVINPIRLCEHLAICMKQTTENFYNFDSEIEQNIYNSVDLSASKLTSLIRCFMTFH